MNLLEQDRLARKRIETEIDRNFFVEAGAGSGKTTELVARMAAMVANGASVEHICAITFTKAAAKEFYRRFQAKLSGLCQNAAEPREKALYERALKDIDLCFMGTIDAFCNKILSEHPAEAGIPMNAALLEEDAMQAALKREWLRAKRGEAPYGAEFCKLYADFELWQDRPDAVFADCIGAFMDSRNLRRAYSAPQSGLLPDDVEPDARKDLASVLKTLLEYPSAFKGGKENTKIFEYLLAARGVLDASWNGNLSRALKLLNKADGLRLLCPPEKLGIRHTEFFRYPDSKKKDWVLCIDEATPLRRKLLQAQYAVTVRVLDEFTQKAAPVLKKRGELGFFDYLLYLRDMLTDDARRDGGLIAHITKRHRYFLVDEFQDTDPLQAEILFLLAAAKPRADWRQCMPRPGALFIVGDPKQSIYRFRGADVSSYLRVKEMFAGETGDALALLCNFRSAATLRGYFNECFPQMLAAQTASQSGFTPIPSHSEPKLRGLAGAYCYETTADEDPRRVAELILSLTGDPQKLLDVSPDGATRRVDFSDVMVIVRGKTRLKDYMDAFARAGIPFRAEGKTQFSQCPALNTLTAVMNAFASPMDSGAVYAALKSDAFALADAAVLDHAEEKTPLRLFAASENAEVASALSALRAVYEAVKFLPPAAGAAKAAQSLHLIDKAGGENLTYYFFALELIYRAEQAGELSTLAETAAFLSALSSDEHERSMALFRQTQGVHLANLHKVKGLEAPVVILAGAAAKAPSVDYAFDREAGTSAFIRLKKRGGAEYARSDEHAQAAEREQAHLNDEVVRLKYVAATRAKNLLIVAGKAGGGGAWGGLAEDLPKYAFETPATQESKEHPPFADHADEREALDAALNEAEHPSYNLLRPSLMTVKSKVSAQDEYEDMEGSEIERARSGRDKALVGTLVHKLLELLIQTDADADALSKQALRAYDLSREQEEKLFPLLKTVAQTMKNGGYAQAGGMCTDLLRTIKRAKSVLCEVPFCTQDGASALPTVLHGVIDLAYEDESGWHILDYKTTAEMSGLDEKYENQLNAYILAFKAAGMPADARIYHIPVV